MSQAGDVRAPSSPAGLGGALDTETVATGLFARKSSGLVRDVGVTGAIGLNLGTLNIGGAIVYFVSLMVAFPGANGFLSMLIGGVLISVLAWVYGQLATTMPRSGGDYVYAGRIFNPVVGAWIGFALLALLWYTIGSAG